MGSLIWKDSYTRAIAVAIPPAALQFLSLVPVPIPRIPNRRPFSSPARFNLNPTGGAIVLTEKRAVPQSFSSKLSIPQGMWGGGVATGFDFEEGGDSGEEGVETRCSVGVGKWS